MSTKDEIVEILRKSYNPENEWEDFEIEATDRLLALMDKVVNDVVGEDVDVPRPTDDVSRDRFYRRSGQNFLKHQQRQTYNEMKGIQE